VVADAEASDPGELEEAENYKRRRDRDRAKKFDLAGDLRREIDELENAMNAIQVGLISVHTEACIMSCECAE
jgi:hypothetical protein